MYPGYIVKMAHYASYINLTYKQKNRVHGVFDCIHFISRFPLPLLG